MAAGVARHETGVARPRKPFGMRETCSAQDDRALALPEGSKALRSDDAASVAAAPCNNKISQTAQLDLIWHVSIGRMMTFSTVSQVKPLGMRVLCAAHRQTLAR